MSKPGDIYPSMQDAIDAEYVPSWEEIAMAHKEESEAKDDRIAELEGAFERFVSSVQRGEFSNGEWNLNEFQSARESLTPTPAQGL